MAYRHAAIGGRVTFACVIDASSDPAAARATEIIHEIAWERREARPGGQRREDPSMRGKKTYSK
ncbi:hypothetical protein EYF80_052338 [Liparis tanakae]|uniref:Uncharacterized protein n=1 Tax=Liparis tanakae TaxID=230148 RepID=A0A4Z2FAT4_9TELE|nr:hypothetical protein EYF80_052338 [Liparis tanakae]